MAEVIAIHTGDSEDRLDPHELGDSDTISLFLSMTTHPSVGSSSAATGRLVNRLIGERNRDDLTEEDHAWRARMGELMIDIDAYDEVALDDLLERDARLTEMYAWLIETKQQAKDLIEERAAVLSLRGIRGYVVEVRSLKRDRDNPRWEKLIRTLGVKALQ